jgi:hypothetical protein
MLKRLMRQILKGLPEDVYQKIDDEIEAFVAVQAALKGMETEAKKVMARAAGIPGEDTPGTESGPEGVNAATLAAAGTLVTQVY